MKKTLFGALAFVLVIATLLTCTVVLAADTGSTGGGKNVGTVKLVDGNPIEVDGLMDEAYTTAKALPIMFRSKEVPGVFTHGWARFVWDKSQNAIYCHVMMNDIALQAPDANRPWWSDSVELFMDFGNMANWGIPSLANVVSERGLQYRIDGYNGNMTCYLQEDQAITYTYNKATGKIEGIATNNSSQTAGNLITNRKNYFGWDYSEDKTKTGWGFTSTSCGYMVEFRINPKDQGIALADGTEFAFDFQVNDRYGGSANPQQNNLFYNSTARTSDPDKESNKWSNITYYDKMTLSETEKATNTYKAVPDAKLVDYGMRDASEEFELEEDPSERTYTSRKVVNRVFTTRKLASDGTTTQKADDQTTTTAASGGGCGSTIAIGTSLAMVAVVGVTGFFTFRKKDDE